MYRAMVSEHKHGPNKPRLWVQTFRFHRLASHPNDAGLSPPDLVSSASREKIQERGEGGERFKRLRFGEDSGD